jgi:hypothetical protein
MYRFVEPVVAPKFFDGIGWQTLIRQTRASPTAAPLSHGHFIPHDLPLDRTARHQLHYDKNGQGDSHECGNDQKEAPDEVSRH